MKNKLFFSLLIIISFTISVCNKSKKHMPNEKLIIGKWQIIQMNKEGEAEIISTVNENMFFEFTIEGRMIISLYGEKPDYSQTYKLEGNKLVWIDQYNKKYHFEIIKLTDKELTIKKVPKPDELDDINGIFSVLTMIRKE